MKNKKNHILAILAVILTVGTAYALMSYDAARKQEALVNNPQTDNVIQDKDQALTDGETPTEDKIINPASPPTSTEPSGLEKPNITRAEMSGEYVRVSATFTKPSGGECVAVFEKDGAQSVSKTAPIIVGPSYYTCNGFRVPRTEFDHPGQWTVTIVHRSNNIEITSDKRIIEIN